MSFVDWVLKDQKKRDIMKPEKLELQRQKEFKKRQKLIKKLQKQKEKLKKKHDKKIQKLKKQVKKQNKFHAKQNKKIKKANDKVLNDGNNNNNNSNNNENDYSQQYLSNLQQKRQNEIKKQIKKDKKKLKLKLKSQKVLSNNANITPLTPNQNDINGQKNSNNNSINNNDINNKNPYIDVNLLKNINNEMKSDAYTPVTDWNPFSPTSPKPNSDQEWAEFDKTFFGI